VNIRPLKQETQEEEQQQSLNIREKQQDTLGQIIKETLRLQKNPTFGRNTGVQKKLVEHVNRISHNRLPRILQVAAEWTPTFLKVTGKGVVGLGWRGMWLQFGQII
jgi:hypothetical protein